MMYQFPNVIGIGLFVVMIILGLIIFWIAGIVSCVQSRMSSNDKLLWLLIILFLNALGSLVYFVVRPDKNLSVGKRSKQRDEKLTRNTENAVFGGVFAGMADYWHVDVLALRILFIVLVFATGLFPLVILYLIFWAVLEVS